MNQTIRSRASFVGICCVVGLLTACEEIDKAGVTYPFFAEASNPKTLSTTANGTVIYNGGFGSSIAADPTDPAVFYLLTDRGPNAAGSLANSIIFGKADFTPQIGKFRVVGDQLVLEQTILLKTPPGNRLRVCQTQLDRATPAK